MLLADKGVLVTCGPRARIAEIVVYTQLETARVTASKGIRMNPQSPHVFAQPRVAVI